eukprot:gene2350-2898_t
MVHFESIGIIGSESEFTITKEQLGKIVDIPRGYDQFKEVGGIEGLEKSLKTSLTDGLTTDEYSSTEINRRNIFSKNILPPPKITPIYKIILETLKDHILIMLIVASVISIVLGSIKYTSHDPKTGWIDGVAILCAVVIVVTITSVNDYKNQSKFRELNKKASDKYIKAIRGGEQRQISIFDITVGDIIIVDTGDIVCADGVFVDGHSMICDESPINGESDPVKKGHIRDHLDPFIYSGSIVIDGFGKMLVTAVGVNSLNGKTLMSLQQDEPEPTPLQNKLEKLADNIGKFGMGAAILLLLIVIPKYFIEKKVNHETIDSSAVMDITQMVIGSITIVVVAVPEGLPLAVTISLAFGMLKMFKENNLVRSLASCETMGSATTICSDKTGTLTQNVMTVVAGYVCNLFHEVSHDIHKLIPENVAQILTDGIAINSNAHESINADGKYEFVGSKTETALLKFGKLFGSDYNEVRKRLTVKDMFPFSSKRKKMSALVVQSDNHYRLYTKGASEIVLEACDRYFDSTGNILPLTTQVKEDFTLRIKEFASDTLRTIGMAYVDIDVADYDGTEQSENLIFIGIVGIRDPLRPEVPYAVEQCKRAGIMVRMVTGDNIITAENIARKCGILTRGGVCIEGQKFRELNDDQMEELLPKLQVLARSSPLDKLILVEKLRNMGEVVAVTGDGTNDGPALKKSDVGFSMGSGTEVAIAASDVVLLDDNFASIVRAVLWGRNIYDSICKFLQFQLTVNIVAVTLAFIGTITGSGRSPLSAVQLLWVNLIMDTLAALALATSPPTPELLRRPPTGRNSPLVSRSMWRNIFGQSIYQLAVLFVLLYIGPDIYENFVDFEIKYDTPHHYTIIFNTFVFMQLFNEINSRVLGNELNPFKYFFNNPLFLGVLVFTVGIQIVFVTFGGEATSTAPLNIVEWAGCVITGLFALPYGFLLRLIHIPEKGVKRIYFDANQEDYGAITLSVKSDSQHKPIESTPLLAEKPDDMDLKYEKRGIDKLKFWQKSTNASPSKYQSH